MRALAAHRAAERQSRWALLEGEKPPPAEDPGQDGEPAGRDWSAGSESWQRRQARAAAEREQRERNRDEPGRWSGDLTTPTVTRIRVPGPWGEDRG